MCTPPPVTAAAEDARMAPLSGASTVSLTSATSALTTADSADEHYAVSHIARRRVVQGAAHVVIYWRKTARGVREIATLPMHTAAGAEVSDAPAAAATAAAPADVDEEDDELVDMT